MIILITLPMIILMSNSHTGSDENNNLTGKGKAALLPASLPQLGIDQAQLGVQGSIFCLNLNNGFHHFTAARSSNNAGAKVLKIFFLTLTSKLMDSQIGWQRKFCFTIFAKLFNSCFAKFPLNFAKFSRNTKF